MGREDALVFSIIVISSTVPWTSPLIKKKRDKNKKSSEIKAVFSLISYTQEQMLGLQIMAIS